MNVGEKLAAWQKAKAEKDAAAAIESQLRREIIAELFPDTASKSTQYSEIGNGWRVKCTGGVEHKVDAELLGQMLADKEIDQSLVSCCMKWTPSLIAANYKSLSDEQKGKLADVITTKPKSPSIEIVAPKK